MRKRSAATVARSTTPAGEAATGWRRFRRKTKVGVVTSAKQAKTVIVTVGRMREHPLYKKVIHLRKGFAAHDELFGIGAALGELVTGVLELAPAGVAVLSHVRVEDDERVVVDHALIGEVLQRQDPRLAGVA